MMLCEVLLLLQNRYEPQAKNIYHQIIDTLIRPRSGVKRLRVRVGRKFFKEEGFESLSSDSENVLSGQTKHTHGKAKL